MKTFIIPSWHPSSPGKNNWCNWILPHIKMADKVCETTVLYLDTESEADVSVIETAHRFFYASISKNHNKYFRTRFEYGAFLNRYVTLLTQMFERAVKKYGSPDIIHAHVSMPAGYGASCLQRKYNIPAIVTEHYSGVFSDIRYPWRLTHFYKKMNRMASGLYGVSPGYSTRLSLSGLHTSGTTPNPVDVKQFTLKAPTMGTPYKLTICSTGNYGFIKGTDTLLQALSYLPPELNWQLVLIGVGDKKWVNDAEKKYGKRLVTFDKRLSQKELADIYNTADIYVMSSRYETANVSMLEAMSCGCRVVTNTIGSSETLMDETVSVRFSQTPVSLAEAVCRAAEMKITRKQLHDYVERHYSIEVLASHIKNIYQSHINK